MEQEDLPSDKRLKVGLIYSYGANDAVEDGALDEEGFDTGSLSRDAPTFLEGAIQDYNDMFGTSFDTSADRFQNYYKDLSLRLKNREIDLVIVVNMFLTGFDAIALLGNKDARGVVLLKPYGEYYEDYTEKVTELLDTFVLGQPIIGEAAQKEFIQLLGAILRLQNILTSFDEFDGSDLVTDRQGQDYCSVYLDLYAEFRKEKDADKEIRSEITRAVDSSPTLRNQERPHRILCRFALCGWRDRSGVAGVHCC